MEIERKFLINGFPNLPVKSISKIEQGYLSIDPEIRIRDREGVLPRMAIKGDGDLSREEIEFDIDHDSYEELKRFIGKPFITKTYMSFYLGKDLKVECSLVDEGTPNEFYYAEIEFKTEEEALAFKPWDFMVKEVTYDSEYKMKNYWKRTRL